MDSTGIMNNNVSLIPGQLTAIKFKHADESFELSFYAFIHPISKELWMTGSDIARCLEYKYPKDALRDNVSEEYKLKWNELIKDLASPPKLIPNFQPHTTMINASGLNQLILRSKLPNAKIIQKWMFEEVLPSLGNPLEKFSEWSNENSESVKNFLSALKNQDQYVYVVTNEKLEEEKIYKIGFTKDIHRRLIALNNSSPYNFRILYLVKMPNGLKFEKFLHKLFIKNRIKREFFKFSDIDETLEQIELSSRKFKISSSK